MNSTKHSHDSDEAPHGYITLWCTQCGFSRKIPYRCKDRTCTVCSTARSKMLTSRACQIIDKLVPILGAGWKHIVLTQPISNDLDYGVKLIIRKFRKLRETKYWKNNIYGGIYSIEAVPKPSSRWHCHIHCIAYGKVINSKKLLDLWTEVCGEKHIAFVRFLPQGSTPYSTLRYIIKYTTKSSDIPDDLKSYYNACMRKRRLFSQFGCIAKLYKTIKLPRQIFKCTRCGCKTWMSEYTLDRLSGKGACYG